MMNESVSSYSCGPVLKVCILDIWSLKKTREKVKRKMNVGHDMQDFVE